MEWEIKDIIAEEMAKAKEYKAQANFGWDYMTHKRLSNMERERSLYFAERHKQIARWLQEFAEMRKEESINENTVENCCKNCQYNGNYDGWNEFICKYYNSMIRGEQYDCEGFELEREN